MKRRTDPVAEILGTSNKKDQVAQIQQLFQLANSPVLSILITFDSRTNRVDAQQVGGQAPNEVLQQILDGAKNLFNQQEIAKQIELGKQEEDELPEAEVDEVIEGVAEDLPDNPPADPEGVPDAD